MKKKLLAFTGLLILFTMILNACSSNATSTTAAATSQVTTAKTTTPAITAATPITRTITYYDGQKITVPNIITRVASGWNAQNSIIAMLGYGDKIVATTDIIKASPIFAKFVPSITNAVVCFTSSGELNIESITQSKPDVVFIMTGNTGDQFKRLEEMGMPVAYLKPNSLQNLIDRTIITGQILGEDAYQRALKYVEYFNNNVKRVDQRVSSIPPEQRVKIYHCLSGPLSTSNAPSLNQDWMDRAGVINVARDWKLAASQTGTTATLEEVVGSNPDVIVCMNAKDAQTIKADPAWANIKAVKEGKVYVNPKGMFWWCRETTEEAMQFLWLAKTVYPDYFKDIDMAQETKYFYTNFYGFDLTDADVQLFLNPN